MYQILTVIIVAAREDIHYFTTLGLFPTLHCAMIVMCRGNAWVSDKKLSNEQVPNFCIKNCCITNYF